MRNAHLVTVVTMQLLLACGDSPSGPVRTVTGECFGMGEDDCTGVSAYEDCVVQACRLNLQACFGLNYLDGMYAGPCAAYLTCAFGCGCDDTSCNQGCQASYQGACMTCVEGDLAACVANSTCIEPACGTGPGGENCDRLALCCPMLPEDQQGECQDTVDGMFDQICMNALSSYQTAGMCSDV